MHAKHAEGRAQQRGIPPLILQWLEIYGEESYDWHGGSQMFFTKASIRKMERDFGRAPVRKLSKWFDSYKVEDSASGNVITVGHRYKRLRRK